jgi:hypothetical protein
MSEQASKARCPPIPGGDGALASGRVLSELHPQVTKPAQRSVEANRRIHLIKRQPAEIRAMTGNDISGLLQAVLLHPEVELLPGQAEVLRGLRLVEAHTLERLLDHVALQRLQVATRRRR